MKKDIKNPFPIESDEVAVTEEKPAVTPTPIATPAAEEIDFDGIESRAAKAPVAADNYSGLSANKGNLIYNVQPPFFYQPAAETSPSLRIFSLKDRKESVLVSPSGGFACNDSNRVMTATSGGLRY